MHSQHFSSHVHDQVVCDSFLFAARILRAVRIAARLGFRFTRETAHFVKNLSRLLLRLDKVISSSLLPYSF
jgi:pantothenate kinase